MPADYLPPKYTNDNSKTIELDSAGLCSPLLDVVQDHPTAWDWRLVLAFVAIAMAFLLI